MRTWDALNAHLKKACSPGAHAHAQLSEATRFLADRCDELDARLEELTGRLIDLEDRTYG